MKALLRNEDYMPILVNVHMSFESLYSQKHNLLNCFQYLEGLIKNERTKQNSITESKIMAAESIVTRGSILFRTTCLERLTGFVS